MQGSAFRSFKILVRLRKEQIGAGSVLVSGQVDGRSGKRWWTDEKVSNTVRKFTKYIYHVGNGKELRSIVRNGLEL